MKFFCLPREPPDVIDTTCLHKRLKSLLWLWRRTEKVKGLNLDEGFLVIFRLSRKMPERNFEVGRNSVLKFLFFVFMLPMLGNWLKVYRHAYISHQGYVFLTQMDPMHTPFSKIPQLNQFKPIKPCPCLLPFLCRAYLQCGPEFRATVVIQHWNKFL